MRYYFINYLVIVLRSSSIDFQLSGKYKYVCFKIAFLWTNFLINFAIDIFLIEFYETFVYHSLFFNIEYLSYFPMF